MYYNYKEIILYLLICAYNIVYKTLECGKLLFSVCQAVVGLSVNSLSITVNNASYEN